MDKAERNRIVPAPILKASRVIPNSSKIYFPKRKITKELIITAMVTLMASRFFSKSCKSLVRERNAESTKKGVRIKKILR
jgi:hypothetical protein